MNDELVERAARAAGLALAGGTQRGIRRMAWYWRKDAVRIIGAANADIVEEDRERDRRVARAVIAEYRLHASDAVLSPKEAP